MIDIVFQYSFFIFDNVPTFYLLVESAKKYKCTPKQALDCKEFSAGYWHWEHLYLIDGVRQFNWPFGFITISPSEWTFPQVRCNFLILLYFPLLIKSCVHIHVKIIYLNIVFHLLINKFLQVVVII